MSTTKEDNEVFNNKFRSLKEELNNLFKNNINNVGLIKNAIIELENSIYTMKLTASETDNIRYVSKNELKWKISNFNLNIPIEENIAYLLLSNFCESKYGIEFYSKLDYGFIYGDYERQCVCFSLFNFSTKKRIDGKIYFNHGYVSINSNSNYENDNNCKYENGYNENDSSELCLEIKNENSILEIAKKIKLMIE
jgi:hypothetical protein